MFLRRHVQHIPAEHFQRDNAQARTVLIGQFRHALLNSFAIRALALVLALPQLLLDMDSQEMHVLPETNVLQLLAPMGFVLLF